MKYRFLTCLFVSLCVCNPAAIRFTVAAEGTYGVFQQSYSQGAGCDDCANAESGLANVALDDCCHPLDQLWAEVDYLQWWVKGYNVPALVTAAPLGSTGASDDPAAVLVVGENRLDGDSRAGVRGRVGWWFDGCQTQGLQAEFFGLEREGRRFDGVSNPPVGSLWRPFFDTNPGVFAPNAQQADAISVASSSEFYSANALYRQNWLCCFDECDCRGYRIDLLGGYRHLRLNEALAIYETASFGPSVFEIEDRFQTDNRFHGGEIGIVGKVYRGNWSFELLTKVAFGNNHQIVRVFGEEYTTTPPGPPTVRNGGLLAQPTNIRTETRDDFAVIPELNADVGYLLTDNLRLTLGYNFLWINRAVRPGDQIDPLVDGRFLNPNLVPPFVPPATRPEPRFARSSLWAQGLNLGLEFNY